MAKNNSPQISIWLSLVKGAKKSFQFVQKQLKSFTFHYPNLLQIIQLTFIYFFALVDLTYSILNMVFSLGYFPQILEPFYPFLKGILQSPIFQIWGSPEKVFFLSYVVIEFMIVRGAFQFTKLVKYNILLIFALLMLQGLIISYWDLLFHRQIATPVAKWAYDQGAILFSDKFLAIFFFFITFFLFLFVYLYLYIKAILGEFATFPAMEWLTDSIAFWLRIQTSTMPFGKRKKK
jgi:hypothetical protein